MQARLRKEIARQGNDTELVGGLTKLGNELERLLRCAAELVCQLRNVSIVEQTTGYPPGSGTYAKVIRDLSGTGLPIAAPPLLRRIVAELHKPRARSALCQLIEIRNSNNHPTTQPLDRRVIVRIMQDANRIFAAS